MLSLLLVRWLHILAAIAVVGLHATYGVWIVRGYNNPHALAFALRTVKLLDNRVALPALAAQLITGSTMVAITRISWGTPWLASGLALFILLVVAHLFVYRPTLRRLTAFVESGELKSSGFQSAATLERNLGIAMTVVMIAIAFLMVVKPRLWG